MAIERELIASDVKCYFCGHISGQILARRGDATGAARFVPRPGYGGEMPGRGHRLRCERCGGPVFLEDAARAELPRKETKRPGEIARAA